MVGYFYILHVFPVGIGTDDIVPVNTIQTHIVRLIAYDWKSVV